MRELSSSGSPVIDDVGSGAPRITGAAGEPSSRRSIAAGAAIICFSADKLLGGPQSGTADRSHRVGGRGRLATRSRARSAIDKLTLAALEATLMLFAIRARAARIPVLAMLDAPGMF